MNFPDLSHLEELHFKNLTEEKMTFEDVCKRIVDFIKVSPSGNFKLMFGTDSHVHEKRTRFITGIVIQNEGKGAWACMREVNIPRRIKNLHEKISIETSLTEDIAFRFSEEKKSQMINLILPHVYKGASFSVEGHLDIGKGRKNKTRLYVNEMISRIESMGVEAKIKPDSFVASSYANKYTK